MSLFYSGVFRSKINLMVCYIVNNKLAFQKVLALTEANLLAYMTETSNDIYVFSIIIVIAIFHGTVK